MVALPADRVAEVFVELADTLVEDFDLVDFLQTVTDRVAELDGVSSAALLLADDLGALQLMAASDERAEQLELLAIRSAEGPGHDSFRRAEAATEADLDGAADRWPYIAPEAVRRGFRAVHAVPLRLRSRVIGALDLFRPDVGQLDAAEARMVQAMADVATIGILQERAVRRAELVSEQLRQALTSRVQIEQAKGAIAAARGCGVDEAFALLRSYSRRHRLRLGDVALSVVMRPGEIPELTERR